jgi:hypothetical protein
MNEAAALHRSQVMERERRDAVELAAEAGGASKHRTARLSSNRRTESIHLYDHRPSR